VSVYPFIEAEKVAERNVSKACALLSVSRSAYSRWQRHLPSARARSDARLGEAIVTIHVASRRTYGAPRITAELRRQGTAVGKKRVARLMTQHGLVGRAKRRSTRTTMADPNAPVAALDRLGRAFAPGTCALDSVYVGDITYIRTHEGWLYLATTIDLASRRVVGFAMADHMRASLVCDALTMALEQRRPARGLIFHADRGSQYTSREFRALLDTHGLLQSLSRPGQCWDNAVAESFFATLKEELVHRRTLPTRAAARRAIFEFIEVFYNRERLHSTLDYRTPVEYEEERRSHHRKETQAA
jgi:putative transposase